MFVAYITVQLLGGGSIESPTQYTWALCNMQVICREALYVVVGKEKPQQGKMVK